MRIITGIAKGRKIKAPEGMNTRPTADRVKEALFNIINDRCFEAEVLDLFAGTGNLGLETISRMAKKCTFVEHDKNTYNILKENVDDLKFNSQSLMLNQDAFAALNMLGKQMKKFDIIFLDPPYGKGFIEKVIQKIGQYDMLSDEGIVISEYDQIDDIPEKIGDISIFRTQKYGRTKLSFWTKENKND